MSRPSARSRRTRVYDCNYKAGENYYKPALDNLDRKYYGRPLASEHISSPARSPFNDPIFSEPIENARRRAERAITEDAFFDVRGQRVPKSSIGAAIDDFDEDVRSSLAKFRANKKSTNFSSDVDFDDTVDSFKRRGRKDFSDALDDELGSNRAASSSIKKSSFKLTSTKEADTEPLDITKWTKVKVDSSLSDAQSSAASLRAEATRARLADLESEMFERSEKQLAREKRSQQLKQFLVDSDIEVAAASL